MCSKEIMIFFLLASVVSIQCVAFDDRIVHVLRPSSEFSPATEVCCNGAIHSNATTKDYYCCGEMIMNRHTQICCEGFVYPRLEDTDCCGNMSYDSNLYECRRVQDTITKKRIQTNRRSYVTDAYVTLPWSSPEDYCGKKLVNVSSEICCDYIVIDNTDEEYTACCGNVAYNEETHLCCRSTKEKLDKVLIVKSHPNHNECCNNHSYAFATHFCSRGNVVTEIPMDGTTLCNNKIMDPELELCCGMGEPVIKAAQQHDSCCSNMTYSLEEGACCCNFRGNGECKYHVYTSDNKGGECCSTEFVVSNATTSLKCCNGLAIYDSLTQTCCETTKGDLRIYEGTGLTCCGINLLDDGTEQCCGLSVIPNPGEGKSECCTYAVPWSNSQSEERIRIE